MLSWSSSRLSKMDPRLRRFRNESITFESNQPGWEFYRRPGHPAPVVAVLSTLPVVPQGFHVLEEEEAEVVIKEVSVISIFDTRWNKQALDNSKQNSKVNLCL